jgi:hypothetical protein
VEVISIPRSHMINETSIRIRTKIKCCASRLPLLAHRPEQHKPHPPVADEDRRMFNEYGN